MTATGRYWIFFVIVAVGLALSWGQVGRKTHRVLGEQPVEWLPVEAGCAPMLSPCAAMAGTRAMVLGPARGGLALKLLGLDERSVLAVEASLMDAGGSVLQERTLQPSAAGWQLGLEDTSAARLRITVVGPRLNSVAEFPLATDGVTAR